MYRKSGSWLKSHRKILVVVRSLTMSVYAADNIFEEIVQCAVKYLSRVSSLIMRVSVA